MSNSQTKTCRVLPTIWLEGFLKQITSLGLSVTRRSAGLPSAILSVVTSPSNEVEKARLFQLVLDTCFQVISINVEEHLDNTDLAQVHAMNVIRALVADSKLSPFARPHLAACFEICIQQFGSPIFPIRNCAAMLFSTLLGKSFGQKKTKSEGEQVNLVFGYEFFCKFPKLYDTMVKGLAKCILSLEKEQIHPLLYPILTILSRMKPVADETIDSHFSLRVFESMVIKCSSAIQWKVREISARTLGVLIENRRALGVITTIIDSLGSSSSSNHAHGSVLQIKSIVDLHLQVCVTEQGTFISN